MLAGQGGELRIAVKAFGVLLANLFGRPAFLSCADNENQRNYQALCRDAATGLEPWVGAIVGPYDQGLESAVGGSAVGCG